MSSTKKPSVTEKLRPTKLRDKTIGPVPEELVDEAPAFEDTKFLRERFEYFVNEQGLADEEARHCLAREYAVLMAERILSRLTNTTIAPDSVLTDLELLSVPVRVTSGRDVPATAWPDQHRAAMTHTRRALEKLILVTERARVAALQNTINEAAGRLTSAMERVLADSRPTTSPDT